MEFSNIKKKLTLLILLLPILLNAQTGIKDGSLIIDLRSKKRQQMEDSIQKQQQAADEDNPDILRERKEKKPLIVEEEEDDPNFKRDGLFKALFIAGLNLSQIDGDAQAGYTHPGAHIGIGTMVKFHKNMSVSAEILYGMKGAHKRLNANVYPSETFRIQWDYIQVPIMFNVHDKKLVMASAGLSLNYLIRNKLRYEIYNSAGNLDTTLTETGRNFYAIEPRKFDLGAVVAFQFLVKKVFGIGVRFEYSLIGLRPSLGRQVTKVDRMYNNSITLRFMYILDPVNVRKKK